MNTTNPNNRTDLGTLATDYTTGHLSAIEAYVNEADKGRQFFVIATSTTVWVFDFAMRVSDSSFAMSARRELCDVCEGHGSFDDGHECADCRGTGLVNRLREDDERDSGRDVSEFAAIVCEFFRLAGSEGWIPAACVQAVMAQGVTSALEAA